MADGPGPLGDPDLSPTSDASATDPDSNPDRGDAGSREESGEASAAGEAAAGTELDPAESPRGSPELPGAGTEDPRGGEGAGNPQGSEAAGRGDFQGVKEADGAEGGERGESLGTGRGDPQGAEGAEGAGTGDSQGAEGAGSEAPSCPRRFEISVCEPERRASAREVFTVYLVESRWGAGPPRQLWRRYSEFELLRHYLLAAFPHVVVPPLPDKRAEFAWQKLASDNMDPDFVERRRAGLEAFLLRVAAHAELARDALFAAFLAQEHGWREAAAGSAGSLARADSRVAALGAAFRLKNPDRRFAELKAYAEELQAVIGALLKVRVRVADRLYGVYKLHANYGRVFSEWSALERRDMGDGLQSAGHHMDVYAASVDDLLEEEEHYTEQLKEYLRFADALRCVCRRAELLQYELETLARELALKKRRREELASGTVRSFSLRGVAGKLFGQEAAETREARAAALGAGVALDEAALAARAAEVGQFAERAARDVARFQKQKERDVREALVSYAVMQIAMCKKGIGVWSNAKECFNKM